jgi:hypothetical protein
MGLLFTNHAKSTSLLDVAPDAITIQLDPATATSFPDLVQEDDYFYLSLIAPSSKAVVEIVKVIGFDKAKGIVEVVRAVDGTVATHHPSYTKLEIRVPAIALKDLVNEAVQRVQYRLVTDRVAITGSTFELSETPIDGGFIMNLMQIVDEEVVIADHFGDYELDGKTATIGSGYAYTGQDAIVSYMVKGE